MTARRTFTPAAIALLLVMACAGLTARTIAEDSGEPPPYLSPLAGSTWQLVRILFMDDSIAEPEERSRYTLSFHKDDQANIRADCNRGTASWRSEAPGHLLFGPVAGTQALCPPPSISEPYLKQFEWVRSYLIEDGHLFLATMADGSIIEFEPALPQEAVAAGPVNPELTAPVTQR